MGDIVSALTNAFFLFGFTLHGMNGNFFLKWLYKAFLLASLVQMCSLWCSQAWEIIILHSSMLAFLRAFLISSVNQLMSQTMELWNSSTIFSCLGWIVRFCNKTVLFSLTAWESQMYCCVIRKYTAVFKGKILGI